MLANDLNENKKDLIPGQKIAQTSTQEAEFSSPKSAQFPGSDSSQINNNKSILKNQYSKSIKRLQKIQTSKIAPREFLVKISEAFDIQYNNKSNYVTKIVNGKKRILRISNHCANSFYAFQKVNETSIVIELSKHEFVSHKDRLVKEYVYFPENLTKDVKDNIIKGLTDWVNTGTYSYDQADKINMSDDMIKLEMRKAERAQFVQNKLSEADIKVVSDKNEFDTIISEKTDGKKMTQGSKIYGFSYQGKIYLNPEIATSETPLHEYTHLWDNYIQNTNRELWEKGKNILRNTKFWEEVKDDPNYAEIAEDEDLLLSEVHAQICGKMADAILAKIQEQDGELTKNTVIDWNNETWTYIVQEFGLENLWDNETKETLENLKEFLSRPMKDLFEENIKFTAKKLSVDFKSDVGDSEELSNSILEGEPIKSISTDDFNYDGSNLKEFALEYIRNNPQGIAITKIGEIEISEAGLRQSLSHTLYKNKLYSIPAIKDTLEKGTYLGVIKDLDGKRQNNYYFAAPILIDGQKDILFIRVKHVAGRNKLFYTHDIFTLDEIKKVTPYSGELNATQRSLRGATLAKSIIQDYEKNNIIQNDPLQFQRNGKQRNLRMTENKFKERNLAQDTTKTKGEERTMEKEKIEVQTYKFQNGETIDEILSKQTEWDTDEGCLDNMIDSSLREVADFADEKEYELLKRISIVKNNPEVDLKLLAVQTDAAARYMAAKHYDDRLADIGKRPFSKDFINPYAQDDFPYELPSWMKNHLEEYPNQNVPEHTSEEEKAYQEIVSGTTGSGKTTMINEILQKMEKSEAEIERMQANGGMSEAAIEHDKNRFINYVQDEQIVQQAGKNNTSLFIPDEKEYRSYQKQLDDYLVGNLKPSDFISLGKTPPVLEKIGVNQNEVVIFQNVIDKALRQPQTDENGRFVQGHEIDVSVLEKLPEYISNPLMVFKSDTVPNSKVIMTEYQDVNHRTVIVALHCDSRADSGKLVVNRISSVYRKDSDFFFLNQIRKGNLEYIDEKRSQEWAVRQRLQLPPLTDILGYNQNITTKEDFVNSQKSLSKKRNVAHEEAPTQGDKSMPGEKKELSFSEQVDLVLAGKYNRFDALKVCDTPDLLLQSGLKQLPMLYTQRHLREAIQQKDLHNHTHGIKIEQIKSLPELIKNPVMIYDSLSRSESLLVLTSEIDVDKMPIVVSIRPNGKGTYELKKVDSNFITSMYGRENFEQHINSVVNNGKIIYWNKEKSQALFSVLGQRLPKGLNNLDPYKILHQTNSVVNTQFQTRTTEQETPTIKNNNEKSQERLSDAKDYLIQTTRLFLSKLKEKNLPFLRGKERGPNIIIRPQAARDAATGKAFTGYTQLMAQALIQALYDQKKLPELEYDLITYDQAKACGTFIKKGSPHITLTNYNRTTNSASKQMYYFKSGCNSPEMIDLHKESIARNRAIKRIRQSLENKEIPSERQTEEKNKITLLHYEEMTYLKALNKDTEQYFDSLTAEEKEMLKTLCSKEPLTQKTVRELAETLRKDRLISAQLSSQKNSVRSFDATECIVPEDFIGKAMAAASLGCSLETTQGTIDRITKDLHQTLSRNIEHYDYGKPFETGEIINGKCRNNVKDMCNKEYEAEELAKKIEQQQMALKKNPINALMELLNRNDLSDRTIGGYER